MKKRAFSVIGTGALGGVLARALVRQKFPLKSLFNRSEDSLRTLAKSLDPSISGPFPERMHELGNIVFITVPDDEIENVAERLALLSGNFSGRLFVHCSGSKTSKALSALHVKGASVASFHPLQTFTSSSKPSALHNIYFDMEGDEKALSFLEELAGAWSSKCMRIDVGAKPYLHAAAVMVSNYMVALLASAGDIAKIGGMDQQEVRYALSPLMQQTLKNLSGDEALHKVLSGPIARGDISTIKDHLGMLEQNSSLLALYKQLGRAALQIAKGGQAISKKQQKMLSEMLKDDV